MNDGTRYLRFLLMSPLLLAGCSLDEPEADGLDLDANPREHLGVASVPASPRTNTPPPGIDPECMDREAPVIGLLSEPGFDCELGLDVKEPVWGMWEASLLFADGSPWVQELDSTAPDQLMRYCKYEYVGDGLDRVSDYQELVTAIDNYPQMDVDTIATDCLGVAPMTGLADAAVVDAFNQDFRKGVGAVNAAALSGLNYGSVRVGLLDSASEDQTPLHAHATHMRHLLDDLLCPGAPGLCENLIHHSLVLPRVGVDTQDWSDGGNVGYATDFALGAYYEIQSWLEEIEDTDEVTRLVLAAPVGYDVGGSYATDPNRATMMAMTDVLEMASCYGALTIAAAGNLRAGTCVDNQSGMLAPATLEDRPAPDLTECTALGYVPSWDLNDFPVEATNGRLVYAVGGVDHDGEMIINGRPDSMPRMAALALAAAGDPDSGANLDELTPLTGTSVATVATAAAAALAWTVEPSLTAEEIMQDVFDSGWATGDPVEDGYYTNFNVRRLSICRLLQLSGLSLLCPSTAPSHAMALSEVADASEDVVTSQTVTSLGWNASELASCEPADLSEVVHPQPGKPACGMCSIGLGYATGGNDALYMSITAVEWTAGLEVSAAYLNLYDASRSAQTIVLDETALDDINLADSTQVLEVVFDAPDTVSADLQFVYDDGYGNYTYQSNALPVY